VIAFLTVMLVSPLVSPKEGSSQDLRPYEPPSARPPRQDLYQSPAQMPRPTVDEAVYERFRNDVQKMTPANRKRLTDAIQQRLERAREAGRTEEVRHNERLLGILGSLR
jgi:hypothetical protein